MKQLIAEFLHLLDDTESIVKRSGDKFAGDSLPSFLRDFRRKRVDPLFRRVQQLERPRYVLSMVGLTNAGKSTLAHALLGHPVAPRLNAPATAVPVEYAHAESWMIKTLCRESQQVITQSFDSASGLSKALEKLVLEPKPTVKAEGTSFEKIEVYGPMDLLSPGLIFADTPGFGAAQSDTGGESQRKSLIDYLASHVHEVMFCISGGDSTVSLEEIDFFREIQDLCSTVIVTKWDSDADERDKEIARYRATFSHLFPFCRFSFVEAKRAVEGKDRQSIDELSDLIRENATREKRAAMIRDQFVAAWSDLHVLAQEPMRKADAHFIPWHPATLSRFRKQTQLESACLDPLP